MAVVVLVAGPGRSGAAQPAPTGSYLPCAAPMSWRIGGIDRGFSISEADALDAVRNAGALWERATGTTLFRVGEGDGFPVTFEFDARQAEIDERRQRQAALDAERQGIEARRAELEEDARRLDSDIGEYDLDAREHQRAVRAYNNEMATARRRRDLTEAEQRELARTGEELEREARRLQARARELNARSDAFGRDSDRLNAWIEAFGARQSAHVGAVPASPTQAGRYDETVEWTNGETDRVDRRIRIFQFSDVDGLVLTLAHELGHALGLGHAAGPGALMSEVMPADAGAILTGGLTPVDVRMLAGRCPELVSRDGRGR